VYGEQAREERRREDLRREYGLCCTCAERTHDRVCAACKEREIKQEAVRLEAIKRRAEKQAEDEKRQAEYAKRQAEIEAHRQAATKKLEEEKAAREEAIKKHAPFVLMLLLIDCFIGVLVLEKPVARFCFPGRYFASGRERCLPCAVGRFKQSFGPAECMRCAPGSSASSEGSYICSPCHAGTYTKIPGQAKCKPCPNGQFSPRGSSACSSCPDGSVFKPKSSACVQCDGGTFSHSGWSKCSPCPAGTWSLPGSSKCKGCKAGTFSSRGANVCSTCPAGHISGSNATACTPCEAGLYAASPAACADCPEGSTSSRKGAASCSCSPGYTVRAHMASKPSRNCTRCPVNSFKFEVGNVPCAMCPDGWTSPRGSANMSACLPPTSDLLYMLFVGHQNEKQRSWMLSRLSESSEPPSSYGPFTDQQYLVMSDLYQRITDATLELLAPPGTDTTSGDYSSDVRDFFVEVARTVDDGACLRPEQVMRLLPKMPLHQRCKAARARIKAAESKAQKEAECGQAKEGFKRLLIVLHPDKFDQVHKDCPPGASNMATREVISAYQSVKALC